MFGNENDRPYVFKASLEGVSAMSAVVQAAKAILKVPFGVNYLWDPNASVAIGAATGRASCVKFSPACLPLIWGSGSRIVPARLACAATWAVKI
jgi:predicted TIM-barrel enzyme